MELTTDERERIYLEEKARLEIRNQLQDQPLYQTPIAMAVQSRPSDGVAAVLSLFVPGAGQMYKGAVGQGIAWLLLRRRICNAYNSGCGSSSNLYFPRGIHEACRLLNSLPFRSSNLFTCALDGPKPGQILLNSDVAWTSFGKLQRGIELLESS